MLRGRRTLALVSSIALAGGALLTVAASPASAATPPLVVCKTVVGNLHSGKLKTCTGSAATGGSGKLVFQTTSKIKWANGKTTTLVNFKPTPVTSGDETETHDCASTTEEFVLTGQVGADTTGGIPVGAKVTAEVCVDSSVGTVGTVVNEPGAKFKIG